MDIDDFEMFKKEHINQFSDDTVALWKGLEARESWTLEPEIEGIAKIFNTLPSVCKYPLSETTELAITELIILIAYLPFTDSVAALAWCGFNSSEWGNAIYGYSYDIYMQSYKEPIIRTEEAVIAAKTIVLRIEEVNRIAVMQMVSGRQI